MGIIKKSHFENKKPAFLWRGTEGLHVSISKLSDRSTASEASKERKSVSIVPDLDLRNLFVPKPSSSQSFIHETPLPGIQDDFRLSCRSAFRVCQLYISNEKENVNMTPLQSSLKILREMVTDFYYRQRSIVCTEVVLITPRATPTSPTLP